MGAYTVACWQDGPEWVVHVREIERTATARRVAHVPAVARGLVASCTDDDPELAQFEYHLLPDSLSAALAETRVSDLEGAAADVETVTVRNDLAWRLAVQGMRVRNLDMLVGTPAAWIDDLAVEVIRPHRRAAGVAAAPTARGTAAGPTVVQHDRYVHEAFLYSSDEEFLAEMLPFVQDGLALGQPVMVAVIEPRLRLLREALGGDAARVRLVDMAQLGANPARIIPAWAKFIEDNRALGRPLRGIGEPIWAGRRTAELLECQFHEALLNLAVDPATPLWLRCPYHAQDLTADVLAEACHSHPIVAEPDATHRSDTYGGQAHIEQMFGAELNAPLVEPDVLGFTVETLAAVRGFVIRRALLAGMNPIRTADLALAVWEVARDSAIRGGGPGELRVWCEDGGFVCEVSDSRRITDPLVGRIPPTQVVDDPRGTWLSDDQVNRLVSTSEQRDGAWLANQLCDLVQVRSPLRGSVVRISSWI